MTSFVLPFPPSTNNLFINIKRGRIRSQRYDSWLQEAGWELNRQRPKKFEGPVILFFEYGKPDKRPRDLDNLLKAPQDLLVKNGVIEADDDSIVTEIRAKWWPDVRGKMRVTVSGVNCVSETGESA